MANNTVGNHSFAGLGTFKFTFPETKFYNIEGKIELPSISAGAGQSAVIVSISANGGADFYTGEQADEGFASGYDATAGDYIEIVFASSAAADQGLNVIKSTISIY